MRKRGVGADKFLGTFEERAYSICLVFGARGSRGRPLQTTMHKQVYACSTQCSLSSIKLCGSTRAPKLSFPLPIFSFLVCRLLFLTHYASWYVWLSHQELEPIYVLNLRPNKDHFDTQSTSYRTQGHIFFSLLIITGNGLIPFMVLSAHLSRNQYSKSPIFMNLCYSLIFYSTSFLIS